MKKEASTSLAETIKKIRERTGLSQVAFYRKYFQAFELVRPRKETFPSDAALQGYMKRLENGEETIPAIAMPIYAELAEVSVDELLTGNKANAPIERFENLGDVFKALMLIYQAIGFDMVMAGVPITYTDDSGFPITHNASRLCIYFENQKINAVLSEYEKLTNVSADDELKNKLLHIWKESQYETLKKISVMNDEQFPFDDTLPLNE